MSEISGYLNQQTTLRQLYSAMELTEHHRVTLEKLNVLEHQFIIRTNN